MTIDPEDKKKLIEYRINQVRETVNEADLMLQNSCFRAAVNRIYYSMFYLLLALGLKYEFSTSKHHQLIGWFNKNFIHTGKINREYGKMLRKAYQYRIKGDYEPIVSFDKETVESMFADLKEFIAEIMKLL
jgi:uncharacterized protein (UPF0332 family)